MCKLNYKLSQGDPTMFSKHNRDGRIIVFIVYVDDVILIGNDIYEMEIVKTKLATEYEIKNLGNLRYFLGIEAISKQRIFISPQKYVLDLLKEVGMLGSTLRVYEDNHNEEFATFNKSMFSIYWKKHAYFEAHKGLYQLMLILILILTHQGSNKQRKISKTSRQVNLFVSHQT